MDKKIEVRDLHISFRTQNGALRAIRGVDFAVEKGETLAIVGESGSGKSVTAKAILGILAGNSIVESGEIIYDGMDLLKLTENEFNELRGNRISMVYQDPLSSLDPIMKIGKQMTEASLVNGKANRKRSKKLFSAKRKVLETAMKAAGIGNGEAEQLGKELTERIGQAGNYRVSYARAKEYLEGAEYSCGQLNVALKKQDAQQIKEQTGFLKDRLKKAANPFLLPKDGSLEKLAEGLPDTLPKLREQIEELLKREEPDFLAYACKEHGGDPEKWRDTIAKALAYNNQVYGAKRQEAAEVIRKNLPLFEKERLDVKACQNAVNAMSKAAEAGIDPLPVTKSAAACTFSTTMRHSMERYAHGIPGNEKELRREKRDTEKYKRDLKRKGDAPKVVPAMLVDLELTRKTMLRAMNDLLAEYSGGQVFTAQELEAEALRLLAWLGEQGDAMANEVSKEYAHDKAIRIMEEVGISEPEKRFEQYPFEFSGGMRQRIVIAIAVAANPDLLICDEPTTALDVTIQSQILELINSLKRKRSLTVIFITHDLGVVANMADRVAVMYAGKLVEYGTVDEVFYEPAHPYTWALLSSMPDLETSGRLEAIPGTPPNLIYPPKGDAFAARNKYALAVDFEKEPPRFALSETHWAATWLLHPKAPKVEMPEIVSERIRRMKKQEEALKNGQK